MAPSAGIDSEENPETDNTEGPDDVTSLQEESMMVGEEEVDEEERGEKEWEGEGEEGEEREDGEDREEREDGEDREEGDGREREEEEEVLMGSESISSDESVSSSSSESDYETDEEKEKKKKKKKKRKSTIKKPIKVAPKPPSYGAEDIETIKALEKEVLKEKFAAHQEGKLVMPSKGDVLEKHLTENDIKKFSDVFEAAPHHSMSMWEFQDHLKDIVHLFLAPNDIETLFMKMDTDHDGYVTWDEFLSYVLLEMREKDIAGVTEELHQPLGGYPRLLKSQHRLPIVRVTFFPVLQAGRKTTFLKGKYVTVSRDGMIHYWTLDFEKEGTAYSECPHLRIRSTWITDMVTLPDVNIICTSSTERDLRFYDVTARKFDLRIIITLLHYPVTCMCYHFSEDITRDSKLVCGDMSGSILLFSFTTQDKGPFYHTPAKYLTAIRYDAVVRGELEHMTVTAYQRVHVDAWVKQVSFYPAMNSFLSCAAVSENSLCMFDAYYTQSTACKYAYNVPKGINCFTIEESSHTLVTGDVDCTVRVWNIFVPHKSSCVFVGHHAPIVAVITQNGGKRVYSLSKDKCIKVWDVPEQKCIQTYISMPSELGGMYMSTLYNSVNRNLIVAATKIAILVLGVVVDTERSDGFTHTMGVVRAMYNPLFRCIVTVGIDSLIMVWDPWEGQRKVLVRNAHTRNYYGDPTAVEITAATFDPDWQQLITGARDGTLKVWNFNTGTCVRTMNIELFCEVTNIIWIKGRIIAVGWNRHVTEFSDNKAYNEGKVWETRHTDDVLCMALRDGQSVATSSYNGELILWRLETGQAYRRYAVATPKARILLTYTSEQTRQSRGSLLYAGTVEGIRKHTMSKREVLSNYGFHRSQEFKMKVDPSAPVGAPSELKDIVLGRSRASFGVVESGRRLSQSAEGRRLSLSFKQPEGKTGHLLVNRSSNKEEDEEEGPKARRISIVRLPPQSPSIAQVSVTAMHFLETRPMKPEWGSLFVAIDKGFIQVWSHHTAGGFISFFLAIHMAGDYVCSMTSDPGDKYLFTGTTLGYIKVWLLENYGFPNCQYLNICMPALRIEFPFLWNDRIEGRAKRSLREQKWPLLVNSYRGHLLAVNYIEYLHEHKAVITCSPDATVRLWTLGGRYLGTLGSVHTWSLNSSMELEGKRVPPDVKLVASSTTMKVLMGGDVPHTHFKLVEDSELLRDLPLRLVQKATYGKRASSPVLGKYFEIPKNDMLHTSHKITYYGNTVPVYRHLKNFKVGKVDHPQPPVTIARSRKKNRGRGASPDASTNTMTETANKDITTEHASKSKVKDHTSQPTATQETNKPAEPGRVSIGSQGRDSKTPRRSSKRTSTITEDDQQVRKSTSSEQRQSLHRGSASAASAAAAAVLEAATDTATIES